MILGTAAYMSPEQARGRAVDQRADIWAFGAILFEMLSGKPPFAGETVTDILARVMERDPDWSALPASTPANVMRVLRRCLEKDPARRLRHVADARLELDDTREPQGRLRRTGVFGLVAGGAVGTGRCARARRRCGGGHSPERIGRTARTDALRYRRPAWCEGSTDQPSLGNAVA